MDIVAVRRARLNFVSLLVASSSHDMVELEFFHFQ